MRQLKTIKRLDRVWPNVKGIDIALLYGSFARNDQSPNSDVDIQLLIRDTFEVTNLCSALKKEFGPSILRLLEVRERNKLVVYFISQPKVEIILRKDVSELDKFHLSAEIIDHGESILYQRIPSLYDIGSYLHQIKRDYDRLDSTQIKNERIQALCDKFIYEFESCSSMHKRSDGYQFYFFYNIALNCVVQLHHLLQKDKRFNFLPKHFLPALGTDNERETFYQLAGSMFLPEANDKKRKLLDKFYQALESLAYPALSEAKSFCEEIYKRDYFWNFRDVAIHNPKIKTGILYRTATLSLLKDKTDFNILLEKYSIRTLIDLRAPQEIEEVPYAQNIGERVQYIKTPFDPWNQPNWFKEKYNFGENPDIAYRFFTLGCKESIRLAITGILDEKEGATAIHCFAGKDRTGILITLIHLLSGADNEIIYLDYLSSESDIKKERLDIALDIIKEHGGIQPYLISCGLSENQILELQKKLFHGNQIPNHN